MLAKKILVVDDSQTERSMMATALTQRGYELLIAEDGPQALEIAKSQKPALVVLDVILPKAERVPGLPSAEDGTRDRGHQGDPGEQQEPGDRHLLGQTAGG